MPCQSCLGARSRSSSLLLRLLPHPPQVGCGAPWRGCCHMSCCSGMRPSRWLPPGRHILGAALGRWWGLLGLASACCARGPARAQVCLLMPVCRGSQTGCPAAVLPAPLPAAVPPGLHCQALRQCLPCHWHRMARRGRHPAPLVVLHAGTLTASRCWRLLGGRPTPKVRAEQFALQPAQAPATEVAPRWRPPVRPCCNAAAAPARPSCVPGTRR